ncbi:class C sortase [Dorea sp. 210702-DFI.3.17]|uniref:class C sortase n=1 Tax=Dorea sp. 210702-DFI.3.17 TaxID=2883208 RepID=UPI001D0832A0|nr:class C sortase [Dorea sp. 210702-DFI.3.17]MCB6490675.1 class C sortase [Dorea sp. 210702-DFI.3.17]
MKKNRSNIILAIIFLIGLSVMLYPSFSNYWNSRVQSRAVASYNNDVQKMSKQDYKRMFQEADDYNEELNKIDHPFENYGEIPGYDDILNVSGTGIIGYVTIDRIKTELPIYHGTSEGVLQIGVGHLEGSSFPVGGVGTHTVLSAHRGLPSAKLFSNLDEMEEGDTFQITVLNRVLTYQVDQIHIVEPGDLDDLQVDPEKDYCTLMTCTPYGINTHRLLVRGVRVDGSANAYVPADAYQIEPNVVAVATTITITVIMIVISFVMWAVKRRKGTIVGKKHEEV